MALHIRVASATDQRRIVQIVRAARINPTGLSWPRFLVAEQAGQLAGTIQVKPHRDQTRELASLAVLPAYQGRGVGAVLVRAIQARYPAPNFFPPQEFQPGSVGDADYTPLVRLSNVAGTPIYNAPVIAFNVTADQISFCDGNPDYSLVHDKVVQICPDGNGGGTVTIALTVGFSFAKPVLYLSTEANDPLPAAMETATFAPGLKDITKGRDDSFASPSERLFAVVNGPSGLDNPQRQGFFSALGDAGAKGPINLLGGIPFVATDYSPLWDLNVGVWTQEAIDKGYRSRMIDEFQYLGMVQRGSITSPDGGEFGSSGFIVNCPVVHRFL
jgi:GNAT superfamily N-acetyltransferase